MPDASWWDGQQHDALEGVTRDVPHLEAEIRRLRAELLRVDDTLREGLASRSWSGLLAAVRMACLVSGAALRGRSRH